MFKSYYCFLYNIGWDWCSYPSSVSIIRVPLQLVKFGSEHWKLLVSCKAEKLHCACKATAFSYYVTIISYYGQLASTSNFAYHKQLKKLIFVVPESISYMANFVLYDLSRAVFICNQLKPTLSCHILTRASYKLCFVYQKFINKLILREISLCWIYIVNQSTQKTWWICILKMIQGHKEMTSR